MFRIKPIRKKFIFLRAVDKKVQNMRMGSMIIKQIYKKVMNLHKEVAITGVYLIAYRNAVDFYKKWVFI